MNREQRFDITNRLGVYLGYTPEESANIIRHVIQALDADDGSDVVVTTEAAIEDDGERNYNVGSREGRREGYMQAIEDVRANELLCNDGVENVELNNLQVRYLDEN